SAGGHAHAVRPAARMRAGCIAGKRGGAACGGGNGLLYPLRPEPPYEQHYYADIVCDHVPLERIAAHAPARLAVVYHSEVPMGASFTLLRAQTGENGWYFVGTDGEKKHFEANLTLTE
ncbi:MAG: hypothetical protein ACLRRT_10895, partial [Ruthenibacterium lactatiformans]